MQYYEVQTGLVRGLSEEGIHVLLNSTVKEKIPENTLCVSSRHFLFTNFKCIDFWQRLFVVDIRSFKMKVY